MNPYKDMTLAARRARESRWKAKTCSRVVHPRFGEVIVPHTSNYAAFPKGTNFAAVTNAQITQAENWINNYPRKILGYKSSEIVFRECLRELGIAA